MQNNKSIVGLSIILMIISPLLVTELYQTINNYYQHGISAIKITSLFSTILILAAWLAANVAVFIKLKYELKQYFKLHKIFYILLLPLNVLTIGILSWFLASKCNTERNK